MTLTLVGHLGDRHFLVMREDGGHFFLYKPGQKFVLSRQQGDPEDAFAFHDYVHVTPVEIGDDGSLDHAAEMARRVVSKH